MVLVKNWHFFHVFILGKIGQENVFHDSFILYNCLKICLTVIYKSEWITDNYSNNDDSLFIQAHTKVTSDYSMYIINRYFFKKCGCQSLPGQRKTLKSTNFIL